MHEVGLADKERKDTLFDTSLIIGHINKPDKKTGGLN